MLAGGCFCGAIRYQVCGTPFHETNCHCSVCRRTAGAPFVTWFSVVAPDFRLVRGNPARFQSTEEGVRSFCPVCGTQLTFEQARFPDEIDVTTCSLDDPDVLPPHDHTRVSSRLRWVVRDDLPEHDEERR